MASSWQSAAESLAEDLRGVFGPRLLSVAAYGPHVEGETSAPLTCLALVDSLTIDDFPVLAGGRTRLTEGLELPAAGVDLEQLERSLVVQALERSGWNQTRAATLLGLNRDQIRYRIEKFKLERVSS